MLLPQQPQVRTLGVSILLALSIGTLSAQPADTRGESRAMQQVEPAWAASAIWYQIFPERFRNGDRANDPTLQDIRGADPLDPPRAWQIHPWGSDWYKLQDYERANGDQPLWKHLLRRRYGGDLQGIIDKLDYLQGLGVTALYLTPIFTAPSLHKYDGACYHHVDPTFGPDPAGDRLMIRDEDPLDPTSWVWTSADELALTLIEEVHRRGMRIIFDGVFNHLGITSFAFQDLRRNQQRSRYRDWFTVTSWEDSSRGTHFAYQGWNGVRSLPELREDEGGIVEGPREYIFAATERWMNPKGRGASHGIDGWRLDVAYSVSHAFWKRWRTHVKTINPEAYLCGELVLPPEEASAYLVGGDEFDGEMNYNFAFACADFFFDPEPIGPSVFARTLEELREQYGPRATALSMNLFDSHDANRIGSHILNRGIGRYHNWGEYYRISKAAENPGYLVRKPGEQERALQKLFVLFQMTYIGAPMIYYGDEAGMWGANDPDCRKPMVWDDLSYESESTNPDGSHREPDTVCVNRDLLAFYQKLIGIRLRRPSLLRGSYRTVHTDDARGLFVFERATQTESTLVAINTSAGMQTLALESGPWVELLEERAETGTVRIPPHWGAILARHPAR